MTRLAQYRSQCETAVESRARALYAALATGEDPSFLASYSKRVLLGRRVAYESGKSTFDNAFPDGGIRLFFSAAFETRSIASGSCSRREEYDRHREKRQREKKDQCVEIGAESDCRRTCGATAFACRIERAAQRSKGGDRRRLRQHY